MEAIILHEVEHFAFEPLTSYVDIHELYLGDTSILMETLNNLYHSGVKKAYFLVELYKVAKYQHLEQNYSFGRKESQFSLKVLGLNVDRMEEGPALREFFSLNGQVPHFVLLYSNTLLTVPILECIETHKEMAKTNSKYCMTAVFTEDKNKEFSSLENSKIVLHDEKNELLVLSNDNVVSLDMNLLNYVTGEGRMVVRYDLFKSSVYLCTNAVIENFLELFDQNIMDELIAGILTQEIKTTELYLTVLKNDVCFPNYPSAVKVDTPRVYYNLYKEYVKRYTVRSDKVKSDHDTKYGPYINQGSYFEGESAISSHLNDLENMNGCVFNSVVGSNVKIGKNSKVYNSILFGDTVIGEDCLIEGSIVMNDVKIMEGVKIKKGSIVGAGCTVVGKREGKLKCANFETKFYDLTQESVLENIKDEERVLAYVWDLEGFTSEQRLKDIGEDYYDEVEFQMPAAELESDEEGSLVYEEFTEESVYEGQEGEGDYGNEDHYLEEGDDYEDYGEEEGVTEEFKVELSTMVAESLQDPKNLENKLLEIRSLRVAHNVSEKEALRIIYSCGIRWVVENGGEDEMKELIEGSKLDKLMGSFGKNLTNYEFFEETYRVCEELGKNELFFCLLCEALYHTEVLDFTGFQRWVSDKKIKEERIVSFAEWVESD